MLAINNLQAIRWIIVIFRYVPMSNASALIGGIAFVASNGVRHEWTQDNEKKSNDNELHRLERHWIALINVGRTRESLDPLTRVRYCLSANLIDERSTENRSIIFSQQDWLVSVRSRQRRHLPPRVPFLSFVECIRHREKERRNRSQ